jgi:hypothetical protein
MSAEEPGPALTDEDLAAMMAKHGLNLDPSDLEPIRTIARFLQRAASRVRRFDDDTAEDRS